MTRHYLVSFNKGSGELTVCEDSSASTMSANRFKNGNIAHERENPSGAITVFTIFKSVTGPMAA